jgi:hypothetical protein
MIDDDTSSNTCMRGTPVHASVSNTTLALDESAFSASDGIGANFTALLLLLLRRRTDRRTHYHNAHRGTH